jgi:hypothetical protein
MKDELKKKEWLESYPVGSEVEVHWGRFGWLPAKVTAHHIESMSVAVEVLTDPPNPTTLYFLYGARADIRRR